MDVARVWVDVSLPHLDREFDYAVPPELAAAAVPGARVRVRFAGRMCDGFVLERVEHTEHAGKLSPLAKVVSAEPVLLPDVATLVRAVADRYAGTAADVLRAAVPPRQARVEAEAGVASDVAPLPRPHAGPWQDVSGGPALLDHVFGPAGATGAGGTPGRAIGPGGTPARAVLGVPPGSDWPRALAVLAATSLAGGRGALVVVPDVTDVARVVERLAELAPGRFEVLTAGLGPAARYRAFLRVSRGQSRLVVGTRGAAFAPVHDLGLVALWDDGDDLHAEPHAPYWHAREVLALRSHLAGTHLVLAGHARTAEAQRLVSTGWARSLTAPRAALRTSAPRVSVAAEAPDATGRVPQPVWRALRDGLREGPVLVQVPRRGYLPVVACQACRAVARCTECSGPLQLSTGHALAACGWCGRLAGDWSCPNCGGTRLRAVSVGSARTAEELGRAFPGTKVISSAGDEVRTDVDAEPALVVATPGAEPWAQDGYAAAALLDAGVLLARADLRAREEALRRWLNAVALVRPGGRVVVAGVDPGGRAVQALVRLDPVGFAERELAERAESHLPPAFRVALVRGPAAAVAELGERAELPAGARVLGPVADPGAATPEVPDPVRLLVSVPVAAGPALAAALKAAAAGRSARKSPGTVELRLDPATLA